MAKEKFSWPKIGNDQAIEFLERGLNNNKIVQTYIFAGANDLGKFTIALAFARNLQGNRTGFNSDLHILEKAADRKNISIEAVREFIKTLNLSSFLNSYKIGIIKDADLLSEEAKSALLKTLEEPKEAVIIILLTGDENSLPATILSRGQILYFHPVPAAVIYDYLIKHCGANRSLAKDLANLALGRPLAAVKFLEAPEDYQNYLERAERWLSLINADLNTRLQILDKIFNDKTWSRQATETASAVLSMAEGLSRDLLLSSLEQKDRWQHSALTPALNKTLALLNERSGQNSVPSILKQLKLIAQAKEYLAANVNPRLVLEQLAVNI
jgi:DNA polymerase-3 subunit delta'